MNKGFLGLCPIGALLVDVFEQLLLDEQHGVVAELEVDVCES